MLKPQLPIDQSVIDCLCYQKVPQRDVIAHVKQCPKCSPVFGTLVAAVDNSLKAVNDPQGLRQLTMILSQAKSSSEEKLDSALYVRVPASITPPMPMPMPMPVPIQQTHPMWDVRPVQLPNAK